MSNLNSYTIAGAAVNVSVLSVTLYALDVEVVVGY